jgi:hypothetical protein
VRPLSSLNVDRRPGYRALSISEGRSRKEHSFTYTVFMKNITLSVDEKVLAIVRRYAAEQNSSVNALVRDYLTKLAAQENRVSKARARLRELSAQSKGRLGEKTWTRDNLHDR